MQKVPAMLLAVLLLACTAAWSAGTKRVVITFKAGTTADARAKALAAIKAKELKVIESNDQQKQFVAVVAEVAETPKTATAMGFADGGFSGLAAAGQDSGV